MGQNRQCLVLMPFAAEFSEVYEQIYKPVCAENRLDCWRVDEAAKPGSITKDIINGIIDADVIIADLTTRNANVFYELGIAHCTGNKTIMTAQGTKDIPFDIGNYRVIMYNQTIAGAKKLHTQLDAAIKELLKSLEQMNNPVQEVFANRGVIKLLHKRLLIEVVNIASFRKGFGDLIAAENLIYVDDLHNLDLEAAKAKHKIGPSVLSEVVALMLKLNIGDRHKLHFLAIKYRFSPHLPMGAFLT